MNFRFAERRKAEEEGTYVNDKIRSDAQRVYDTRHAEAEEGHHW